MLLSVKDGDKVVRVHVEVDVRDKEEVAVLERECDVCETVRL